MIDLTWDDLTPHERHTLSKAWVLEEDQLHDAYLDDDLLLFENADAFWSWYIDEDNIEDLFHDLLENGEVGAMQHGSIKNYALRATGAIPFDRGVVAFCYG